MRFSFRLAAIFLIFILAGAGCVTDDIPNVDTITPPVLDPSTNSPPENKVSLGGSWRVLAPGTEQLFYQFGPEEGDWLMLYRLDPNRYSFQFETSDAPKYVSEWKSTFPEASFILNGTYFHEDYSPSGLLITDGEEVSTRHFDWERTALLTLSPKVDISTPSNLPNLSIIQEAAQSYPLLIKNGKPAIKEDSGKTARRTFIGTDTEGNVIIGMLPQTPLSLHALAKQLMDLEPATPAWKNVLNLDGGPSTGFTANINDYQTTIDSYSAVPNVIIIEQKVP